MEHRIPVTLPDVLPRVGVELDAFDLEPVVVSGVEEEPESAAVIEEPRRLPRRARERLQLLADVLVARLLVDPLRDVVDVAVDPRRIRLRQVLVLEVALVVDLVQLLGVGIGSSTMR